MNKKLIAAAIAAIVAAPAVSAADTTLYGKLHASINNADTGTSDQWNVSSHASRIGVKGSEDLDGGMKAIFGAEFEVAVDENDGINGARNTFIGLSGDFGTFLVGRHDTPAKVAFYAAGNETLSDSIVDINRGGFTEFRLDNAIAYVSPSMSGFTVAAAVVPGENKAGNSNDGLADAYSLGAMYSGGGLKASVGYEVASKDMQLGNSGSGANLTLGGVDDHKMLQVGASYTFGDFMIGANYEDTENNAGSASDKEVWGVTGKATFGNNFATARYTTMEVGTAETDTVHLAVAHNMSSRTQVYVAYENVDPSVGSDSDTFALGMVHTF